MQKNELIKELESEFSRLKKKHHLNVTLKELDEVFGIKDYFLRQGFISPEIIKHIAARNVEIFNSWMNYIHNLIMPTPQNMVSNAESQIFTEKEKEEFIEFMNKVMAHTSKNTVYLLNQNKEKQAEFIEESYHFWIDKVRPELVMIMEKINAYWENKA
ncbi:MAG: hypothetical protein ACQESF_03930 [Nanobdellota archaeon]